jgi:thymidylate synthase (FAD)
VKGQLVDKIDVLDHGYVKLLNLAGPERRVWGSEQVFDGVESEGPYGVRAERPFDDTDPANVARMSFGQKDSGRARDLDLKLARYLMQNRHSTPFEFIQVYLEMKLPIFVARQFVRHRTVSISEVSARYTKMPGEWYVPEAEQVGAKAVSNKQGRGEMLPPGVVGAYQNALHRLCAESYSKYEYFLGEGMAPEVARLFLHVNHYTAWIWSQDLHSTMHFLSLRLHSHAQWEARQYAEAVYNLLYQHLPESMNLFNEFRSMK